MSELEELFEQLEKTLHGRLHAKNGGALHDIKNFHSYDDFVWLLEESDSDCSWCIQEMDNVEDCDQNDIMKYQSKAENLKNKFQAEVRDYLDTLDFNDLEAQYIALK